MSEPIRLFRGGQEIIITAPSQVQLLIREGWSETPDDDVPFDICLLYTSPSPRDRTRYRMPSSACKKKTQKQIIKKKSTISTSP